MIGFALGAPGGHFVLLLLARRTEPLSRRQLVGKAISLASPQGRRRLVRRLERHARHHDHIKNVEIYWLAAANAATVSLEANAILDPVPPSLAAEAGSNTNLLFARAIAAYETSRYKQAVEAYDVIRTLAPLELVSGHNYLKAAYAAGQIRQKRLATELFAQQFFFSNTFSWANEEKRFDRWIFQEFLAAALEELQKEKYQGNKRIGVFFLSSTEALGHAILDPYYFLAMQSKRFDAVIFVGPRRSNYRPASQVCLEIVEQYGQYIETRSDVLLNLSWMSLETRKQDPVELTCEWLTRASAKGGARCRIMETRQVSAIELAIENYWSLLREAVHRTRDADDTFRHNTWHMRIPDRFVLVGEAFCLRHGIDLARPLVVLHARSENYHAIEKQSFRNADIDHYVAAVRHLIDSGYQVVRIGDRGMTRLRVEGPGYYELPFLSDYKHMLDPFLISRSAFMIGCQSGPCAYARALGAPLLSVNAVLHYTLLPAPLEMACFKRYVRKGDAKPKIMSLESALAAGVYHFDGGIQFERAGIYLEQARSNEILASVKDMIVWLSQRDLPETPLQLRFRDAVESTAKTLRERGDELDLPVGDFLGISLPGYRISPTVAAMRESEAASIAPDVQ